MREVIKMKIIRNEIEYNTALARIEELIDIDPLEGTDEADELDVLTLLIKKYEDEKYPIDLPDPIEALKFRMEQMGLKNSDLIPYIGSKGKVSEVLNRKRSLSLNMMRKLYNNLGVPAEVLLSEPGKELPHEILGLNWSNFPLSELIKKTWIEYSGSLYQAKEQAEELLRDFFNQADLLINKQLIFYRKNIRTDSELNKYALHCWKAKVLIEAKKIKINLQYNNESLNSGFFHNLAVLSCMNDGPLLAKEFLGKNGIKLVMVAHLAQTHLDGACLFNQEGIPIIALTLRHDRLDNFWFTLFHEIAHLKLHLNSPEDCYFDNLDATTVDKAEQAADYFATNSLINPDLWNKFYNKFVSKNDIIKFSNKLSISPAIIAGRIRKKRKNYKIFNQLVGQKQVKIKFTL